MAGCLVLMVVCMVAQFFVVWAAAFFWASFAGVPDGDVEPAAETHVPVVVPLDRVLNIEVRGCSS